MENFERPAELETFIYPFEAKLTELANRHCMEDRMTLRARDRRFVKEGIGIPQIDLETVKPRAY